MKTERILDEITTFYGESDDFNGLPLEALLKREGLSWPQLEDLVIELVRDSKISLTFSSVFPNPHIKAFPDLPPDEQLKRLESEGPEGVCAYPTERVLKSAADVSKYEGRPFTQRLLLGEPQLKAFYFDLTVLERYFADPRYHFDFYDYGGSINISDKFYEAEDVAEKDKVVLQTFGLGYDLEKNRVVVVFLRYLSDLSPEHQQAWSTFLVERQCKMVKDYYRNSILGEWADNVSIYEAFLEEQAVINQMCQLMGRPGLFKKNFTGSERPKEFTIFLRPTLKNYLGFLHLLDKMLSENINKKFFRNEVALEEESERRDGRIETRPRGTLAILNEWLGRRIRTVDASTLDEIMGPLREVRADRRKPAHTIQDDEYDRGYHRRQDDLMVRVYGSLRLMRLLLASHPNVTGFKVPDDLREQKIVVY